MTLQGTVLNGAIVLDEPPSLPEGTRVQIAVTPLPEAKSKPTLLSLLKVAGTAKDLPEDFAAQHDHYLHGMPQAMKTVFADSFYFFALVNEKDPAHARATAHVRSFQGRLLTAPWVLTEVGDGHSHPHNRGSFTLLVDALRGEPNATILPCNDRLLEAGIELFRQRPDKDWSLTDCISFVVMQQEGLTEALTGDHHFEQAGFIALLT